VVETFSIQVAQIVRKHYSWSILSLLSCRPLRHQLFGHLHIANIIWMNSHQEQMLSLQCCHTRGKPFIIVWSFFNFLDKMKLFLWASYDMEDAMILNKSAVDRGMFRGHIYQASYAFPFITISDTILSSTCSLVLNYFTCYLSSVLGGIQGML
jgi:hypothetical protein